ERDRRLRQLPRHPTPLAGGHPKPRIRIGHIGHQPGQIRVGVPVPQPPELAPAPRDEITGQLRRSGQVGAIGQHRDHPYPGAARPPRPPPAPVRGPPPRAPPPRRAPPPPPPPQPPPPPPPPAPPAPAVVPRSPPRPGSTRCPGTPTPGRTAGTTPHAAKHRSC